MKKKLITFILLFVAIQVSAQEQEKKEKANELKLNVFNTLIFKSVDASYERLLNDESAVGISFFFNLNEENSAGPDYNEQFAITPYYRHFFSHRYAWGFFMEAFGMYNEQEIKIYESFYIEDLFIESSQVDQKSSNFALGFSIGGKFVSQKGFLFEFYAGVGRNLYTSNSTNNSEFVPRLGISLGHRF